MDKYDVIVIGAGNGGLGAACRILNAGKTCLVCEKHNIPGGFATSFVRGRFEFEASLHEFNGIGTPEEPGSTRILFEQLGVADKIEWIQLKDAYHLISEAEGYDFVMPFGWEAFAKANNQLHPDGEKYINEFFELCQQIRDAMGYIGEMKGKPDPQVMMEKYPDYLACGSYSVNEAFEALGYPKEIVDNLNTYWCYLGADGNNLSFLHYANMIYSYFSKGAAIPKYRSHELSLAFEERFYMGLIGSSGKGGATLHRRIFGEGLENLANSGEYHWMAGNYIKYCAIESKTGAWNAGMLPVDSHELIALCAPRLVFISYGIPEKGDALWLDQYGSWQATVAAGEVFKLLGAKDLGLSNDYRKEPMPPVLTGLLDGELAWRQHDGGHTDGPNMKYFIEWATGKIRK